MWNLRRFGRCGLRQLTCLCLAVTILGDPDAARAQNAKSTAPKITAKHFRIYTGAGQPATLGDIVKRMKAVQITFLGESHDDPAAHHLQLRLFNEMHQIHRKDGGKIALSLEMFERDVQHILDEYLSGLISEKHFLAASRPWKNYQQAYRPLVEYARTNKISVIAANAPRRYVNRVGRLGAASLHKIANPQHRGLPPLPYGEASRAYANKFRAIMKKVHKKTGKKKLKGKKNPKKKPPQRKFDVKKALAAQSLWDAAMAYSIAEHLLRAPDTKVVHVNGSFHSDSRLGIPDHLRRYRPGTSFLVVTILPHKSFPRFDREEMNGRGDFVIVTDSRLRMKKDNKK